LVPLQANPDWRPFDDLYYLDRPRFSRIPFAEMGCLNVPLSLTGLLLTETLIYCRFCLPSVPLLFSPVNGCSSLSFVPLIPIILIRHYSAFPVVFFRLFAFIPLYFFSTPRNNFAPSKVVPSSDGFPPSCRLPLCLLFTDQACYFGSSSVSL